MMAGRFALLLGLAGLLGAQSITITAPASAQAVSGSAVTLSVSYSNLPALYSVQYVINGEPQANFQAHDTVRCPSCSAGAYSLSWNSFYVYNGTHSIAAVARDAVNNTLATSSPVSFTVANILPEPPASLTASYSWPSSGTSWSGTKSLASTISGTGSAHLKDFRLSVDGGGPYQGGNGRTVYIGTSCTTATSDTGTLDTTKWYNGVHNVVEIVYDFQAGGAGNCTDSTGLLSWRQASQQEVQVTFSNPATPVEIRASAYEVRRVPGGAAYTFTCQYRNTDLSLSACASPSYSTTADSSICTVNASTGLTTPGNAEGACPVTISSGGRSRTVWMYVYTGATAGVPHFKTDGSITTTWSADSLFVASTFATDSIFKRAYTADQYATAYLAAGMNTVEPAIGSGVGNGSLPAASQSQSAWQAAQDSYVSLWNTLATNHPGLLLLPRLDNTIQGGNQQYAATRGNGSAWSPTALAYLWNSWYSTGHAIAMRGPDEVTGTLGPCPYCGGLPLTIGATSRWTTLTASGGTCSFNNTDYLPFNLAGHFILHGSAVAGLNSTPATATVGVSGGAITNSFVLTNPGGGYNSAPTVRFVGGGGSGAAAHTTVSGGLVTSIVRDAGGSGYSSAPTVILSPPLYDYIGTNPITFACPVSNQTRSAANDPGLAYEPWAYQWFDANQNTSDSGSGGPWIDYVHADMVQNYFNKINALSPRLKIGMPPAGISMNSSARYWFGAASSPPVSEWVNFYVAWGNWDYLSHTNQHLQAISDFNILRTGWNSYLHNNAPLIALTGPLSQGWKINGNANVPVVSCVNDLITFSSPHGIYNVIENDTRLVISGSSDPNCNKRWYVRDAPTATTVHVAGPDGFSASVSDVGTPTLTMADGSTFQLFGASCANSSLPGSYGCTITMHNDPACASFNKRGQTATISGGSGGWTTFQSHAYYLGAYQPGYSNTCYGSGNGPNLTFWVIPTGISGTGGNATIISDNTPVKGARNYVEYGSSRNAAYPFMQTMAVLLQGATGVTAYQIGFGSDAFSRSTGLFDDSWVSSNLICDFGDGMSCNGAPSYGYGSTTAYGAHPYYDNGSARELFEGQAAAVRLGKRFLKFLTQPWLDSPDYGYDIPCAAHSGASGNILFCVNFASGPWTRTFDLSPYLISGQPIVKYYGHWWETQVSTLAAGTLSDAVNGDGNDYVIYLFPATTSAELEQPTLSVGLADVPNATKVIARCAYSPWLLENTSPRAFDLGDGTGTLPVDPAIGRSYCRLLYSAVDGRVLATSDVQLF